MLKIKSLLTATLLLLACAALAQTSTKDELRVLAKLVSYEGGSKVHFAKFKVIKNFSSASLTDTIYVGYYFYKENKTAVDTVLLRLLPVKSMSGYYACADFDATKGMQPTKVVPISVDYWEACETGRGDCNPISIIKPKGQACIVMLPCGGTYTEVTLTSPTNPALKRSVVADHSQCPLYMELTGLQDGKYKLFMRACGLGGGIELNLATR